jgi:hypothetical protein
MESLKTINANVYTKPDKELATGLIRPKMIRTKVLNFAEKRPLAHNQRSELNE